MDCQERHGKQPTVAMIDNPLRVNRQMGFVEDRRKIRYDTMMCELVAYLVKSVLSDCMKFDNVAMVEIISIEGDLVFIDKNAKVSNNGNVHGYNINNDLVRLADNVKLGFNRRFGVSVDSDNHTDALFNLDEIDRIYLTINHETKALIPYLTPKGVVWEYTE